MALVTPTGQWVYLDQFVGEPGCEVLAWWWNSQAGDDAVAELDEILVGADGRIRGKASSGMDVCTHVMRVGFERPVGPPPFGGR